MSAFFVNDATIDAAVTGLQMVFGGVDDPTELGKELWRMNRDAVTQRYPHDSDNEGCDLEIDGYVFVALNERFDDFRVILKQMQCLSYQCSEGDVPERELFKRLEKAEELLVELAGGTEALAKSPVYQKAPWGRFERVS